MRFKHTEAVFYTWMSAEQNKYKTLRQNVTHSPEWRQSPTLALAVSLRLLERNYVANLIRLLKQKSFV